MRGSLVAIGLAVVAMSALWWSHNKSLTPDERLLFSKLDAAIMNAPPQANNIIAAFDLPEACREKNPVALIRETLES
jgi:hypothetical protein